MLVQAVRSGNMPLEQTLTIPVSIPALDSLASWAARPKAKSAGRGGFTNQ
jgi:hypothetical protein